MRIKRIEIIGFKSFCDRTVLNFDEPITAVVGPNGCGKSNIVDAIRWCMGEQSAKHLRGQAMGDVIFNGSETRGPAGMAEVALTFEDVGFSHETLALELEKRSEDREGADPEASAADPIDSDPARATGSPGHVPGAEPAVAEAAADGYDPETAELTAEDDGAEPGPPPVVAAEAAAQPAAGEQGEQEGGATCNGAPAFDPEAVAAEMGLGAPGAAQAEAARVLEDRPPAIDFTLYNEVTVSRRLFRDGTSGYFINKIPCRLRDITDFFLGTGVGTKAYSIIEQGRIGMIVSSRPQERRNLIEEAAGITKFKTKKRLAERKLEQTRQNLTRVNDIVEELAKRLGSLRRQAQKAARYRQYRAELKDIELWIASHRYLELAVQARVLARQLAQTTARRDDARLELESRDAQIVAERADLAVEERRLAALQEQIFELENRIKLDEEKIKYQTREADELEQRASDGSAEIRSLVNRREEVANELAESRRAYDEVEQQAISIEEGLGDRQLAVEQARTRLVEAQQQLDNARAEVAKGRADMARAESQEQAVQRRRADAQGRAERLGQEADASRQRLDELKKAVAQGEAALGDLRQLRLDLGQRTSQFERRLEALTEENDELEARVETLRDELHRRKSRLQSLLEIQQKYEGFTHGTRAVMKRASELHGDSEVRGLVADIVSAPPQLEVAVETALGDRLGGVLVESHNAGLAAIRFLKDSNAGRSTFIPVRGAGSAGTIAVEDRSGAPQGEGVTGPMLELVKCEPEFELVVDRLFRDYWVVDTLDAAIALHRAGCTKTLVTLDGDLVDSRGVVTGGSRDAEGAGVLAQKREIRELEQVIGSLEADLADATARFVSTKNEAKQLTRAIEAARSESHDHDIDIVRQEKDVARAQSEYERLRERVAHLDAERAELAETMDEAVREGDNAAELLASARERTERYEREQLGLIESVDRARVEAEELGQALTSHKIRVAQLDEKKASLSATVLRLESTAEELVDRTKSLEQSIRSSIERAHMLRDESRGIAERLTSARDNKRGLAEQADDGRTAYERRLSELQVSEASLRALRSQADALGQTVNKLEVELHDLDTERMHLEESIAERYRINLAREVGDYHLRPPVEDEQHKRVQELKRLIDRMGADINLTAIEEYEQISKRHDFLSAQKVDLESACDQLERAIGKINKTSRRLFRDTFDAINSRFKEVFPRLFRGGQAYLSLTQAEGQDILESGVEIMARPPGKKNSTVEQLSGGEKALTAVALIFAIFLFKPSPFCLLDEVDAPLDDVNVDRYNEIVRSMTDRSQFIVITHNKRTMEIADQLYGITMQEPGCSKVVNVNLRAIDEFAA
jgi:chromosome segregation protein